MDIDIDAVVADDPSLDAGVPCGAELLRFAKAAQTDSDELADARSGLRLVVGDEGLLEAAATVAIFNGLVRVADGTGIQLDEGVLADSEDYRDRLGVSTFGGAENSQGLAVSGRVRSIADMFGSR